MFGHRYGWSKACNEYLEVGDNFLEEHEAWELIEAIETDESFLPCLSEDSNPYDELAQLMQDII